MLLEQLSKQSQQYLRLTYSLYKKDAITIDSVISTVEDFVVLNLDFENYNVATDKVIKELEENYNRATDWRIIEE